MVMVMVMVRVGWWGGPGRESNDSSAGSSSARSLEDLKNLYIRDVSFRAVVSPHTKPDGSSCSRIIQDHQCRAEHNTT
jgi:hypothetical protein